MQHGKVANEELPAMEAMLKEFQEEALKDGKIDADEQEAIDALKAAVTAMQEAAADGLVTADELERIAVAKKEGLRLAAGASSGGLYRSKSCLLIDRVCEGTRTLGDNVLVQNINGLIVPSHVI